MFELSSALEEKINAKINNDVQFCPISEAKCSEDCSCKGGCGTYTPPCSCCAYN